MESKATLLLNTRIVNEGKILEKDVLLKGSRIEKIDNQIDHPTTDTIDLKGNYLIPGLIDDQVHFREPGLTHKAEIYTEARAAVAGGITSYMEMPNTVPQSVTQERLEEKYKRAAQVSLANYSFYMGATNDNIQEVLRTDPARVCGVKIFMGSSTGNMLVDNEKALNELFSKVEMLIATHCEYEPIIRANTKSYVDKYGDDIPIELHPYIRSREACYESSSRAVSLAKKYGTRLHVLHISTAEETKLFKSDQPLNDKTITAEACIHHLWFSDKDYKDKGTFIKWNPAVKKASDREEIIKAVIEDRIDIIATDHAPHTRSEKQQVYTAAPSGGPLVQHGLPALLDMFHEGKIPLETIIQKASHNPAILFRIEDRGFVREGYFADLVEIDLNNPWTVDESNILYKCGWSPFEGHEFKSKILRTWVSGHLAYENGKFNEEIKGMRMSFKP
jgi:dihydroorotase